MLIWVNELKQTLQQQGLSRPSEGRRPNGKEEASSKVLIERPDPDSSSRANLQAKAKRPVNADQASSRLLIQKTRESVYTRSWWHRQEWQRLWFQSDQLASHLGRQQQRCDFQIKQQWFPKKREQASEAQLGCLAELSQLCLQATADNYELRKKRRQGRPVTPWKVHSKEIILFLDRTIVLKTIKPEPLIEKPQSHCHRT